MVPLRSPEWIQASRGHGVEGRRGGASGEMEWRARGRGASGAIEWRAGGGGGFQGPWSGGPGGEGFQGPWSGGPGGEGLQGHGEKIKSNPGFFHSSEIPVRKKILHTVG